MVNRLFARAFYWLAQAMIPLGRTGAGAAHWFLSQALMFDPRLDRARGWLYLIEGSMARDRGDIESAVALLRQCATILPHSDVVIANLGIALTMAGKHEEAIQVIERSMRGEADLTGEPQIWTALAWSYLRSGRAPKALDTCERAQESRAGSPEIEVIRRLAHGVKRGLIHREDLSLRLRAAPRIVPLALEFCQHLARTGERDLARQVLSCLGPSLQERAYVIIARSAMNDDDLDTASWAVRELENRHAALVTCGTLQAEIALRRGETSAALQHAAQTALKAPQSAMALEQLARVQLVAGEWNSAVEAAEKAVALKGAGALAAGLVALRMADTGQWPEARRLFHVERSGDALACAHAHAAQALLTAVTHQQPEEARSLAAAGLREALDLPDWAARPHVLERLMQSFERTVSIALLESDGREDPKLEEPEELLAHLAGRAEKLQRQAQPPVEG